jgi:hypothetical protein
MQHVPALGRWLVALPAEIAGTIDAAPCSPMRTAGPIDAATLGGG